MAAMINTARELDREILLSRFRRIRDISTRLAEPLSAEDMSVQAATESSPTKWHLAHTTWFFETFVLEAHQHGFQPYNPAFRVLFNSYYHQLGERHPRAERGLVTRPGVGEVMAYRDSVDDRVCELLRHADAAAIREIGSLIELGLQHEQQHQELLVMDMKRLLHASPLEPAYLDDAKQRGTGPASAPCWIGFDGGVVEVGHEGEEFAYDNEGPRHRRFLEPYALASRPVTNAEYIEFIEADGYRDSSHWLDDGWSALCEEGWVAPMYWRRDGGSWTQFTVRGRENVRSEDPVSHLSFFEADAYARWAGARLPTECEWEHAANSSWESAVTVGQFQDGFEFEPRGTGRSASGFAQLAGGVWEWTRSAHEPYPGYRPPEGAVGEYNGKFMCGTFVLRGGSCATPRDHVRPTYRNFFRPGARWQFSGVRLARSVGS